MCLAKPALAETRRLAVIVGNNNGGPTETPLHYAEEDASKVADVLAQLGDVHADELFLLKGRGRDELKEALSRATGMVTAFRQNPGDRTVLVFYYSGHSDGDALELGADRVPYSELREWVRDTKADVRVLVLDGCKSGALMQSKGGTKGPAFEINLTDQLDATGEAILTSSAADELALESREIRGSFFTHHFVSGLRGAADASGDGRVTLAEAYQYAFSHTLAATSATGLRQHPGYDYRLAGKGELVLTEMAQPSASLELPTGFERALIVLVRRDQVLAELTSDAARRVALAPGEYAVRAWKGTQAYATRVLLAAGESKNLTWAELQAVSSPSVASKGHVDIPEVQGLDTLTPEAQAEYLEKYVTVGDVARFIVTRYAAQEIEPSFNLYQGKYRKPLDGDDFYALAGRADLASRYQSRQALRIGLTVGAGALIVGGVVYSITGIRQPVPCGLGPGDPNFVDRCITHADEGSYSSAFVGIAGVITGSLLAIVGLGLNPHPVEAHEVRRLAEEYNAGLMRRLGNRPDSTPSARNSGVTFQFKPYASPRGGGLALAGTF